MAIFTKFDVLITLVYDRNKDEGENITFAHKTLKERFEEPLKGYVCPPCAYLHIECMPFLIMSQVGLILCSAINDDNSNHQEQVGKLIKQTTTAIDNLALKMLFITVQKNNLEICIEYAVNEYVANFL